MYRPHKAQVSAVSFVFSCSHKKKGDEDEDELKSLAKSPQAKILQSNRTEAPLLNPATTVACLET